MSTINLISVYRHAYDAAGIMPFPFQRAVAEAPETDILIAPTGLGKTAAVTLGWAWRRLTQPATTPRRLVWCLPMRTLVEQTEKNARCWMSRLAELFKESGAPAPKVHILMGGAVEDDWRLAPDEAAIIVGTQDMLLSRALMRGYGMSRFGWAVDYGLLHADALWVFDEVQLMGAGLATSAQLEAFRRRQGWSRDGLAHSLWVSATLEPEWLQTAEFRSEVPEPKVLRWNDLGAPEPAELSNRLDAVKRLRKAKTSLGTASAKAQSDYVRALAKEVIDAHRNGTTTLAIVNTVRRAQDLYREVCKSLEGAGRSANPILLHSRYRQRDRDRTVEQIFGGTATDRIVVATQAVEAGVDITSATLFTELAPWTSLVQRFGRCNRKGECGSQGASPGADIFWVDVEAENEAAALPYEADELAQARERIVALEAERGEVSPRTLLGKPPSPPRPPRQVIRPKDFEELFDTDPDLSGYDLDISPYIRDGDDMSVEVFWRRLGDDAGAKQLTTPPRREELCPAPLGSELTKWLKDNPTLVYVENPLASRREKRKGQQSERSWVRLDKAEVRLRPGLTLLLHASIGGYDEQLGFVGGAGKDGKRPVEPVVLKAREPVGQDGESGATVENDGQSYDYKASVTLADHTRHVVDELESIVGRLREGKGFVQLDEREAAMLVRAAWWHDLGKAYAPFQDKLGRVPGGPLLAKSQRKEAEREAPEDGAERPEQQQRPNGLRRYFRHELASALAFLAQHDGEPDADLVAYLIAAHHGKVRTGLRALPEEETDKSDKERPEVPSPPRICRGVQDGDLLENVEFGPVICKALPLDLSLMELGEDANGRPSWAARTQELLARLGPFRLAYLEALLRAADWRASKAEREGRRDA
jgi:CRISPR-associated endonuclease/helicase Cas3